MANEENRFSARAARYMRVGTNVVGAVAARVAPIPGLPEVPGAVDPQTTVCA
jgi:hypothetical protein